MSVQQLLERIRALPLDEYADLVNFLNEEGEYQVREALRRDTEMSTAAVEALSRSEVFSGARSALRST